MPRDKGIDLDRIPNRPLVIYAGRFQPLHVGHKQVYDQLVKKFGPNVYIATTDKTDPVRSPFTFKDKLEMARAANIPLDKVVQVKNPYVASEIKDLYDPAQTIAIFAIGEKDMETDPRFEFAKDPDAVAKKKDGSPAYLQRWRGPDDAETMDKHAYVDVLPTVEFLVLKKPMTSATEIRKSYAAASPEVRDQILRDLYGKPNKEMRNMFDRALTTNSIFESLLLQLQEIQKENEFAQIAPAYQAAGEQRKKVIYTDRSRTQYPYKVVDWSAPGDPVKPNWPVINEYIRIGRELRRIKLALSALNQKHTPEDNAPWTEKKLARYRAELASDTRFQELLKSRDKVEREFDDIKSKLQHMPAKLIDHPKSAQQREIDKVFGASSNTARPANPAAAKAAQQREIGKVFRNFK